MANILLTQRCVRSCPYCFAKKHMDNASSSDNLSWDNLLYLADFFEISNERHISLLGGEPTLHPDFTEFVVYLLERNFHITVFTSGIMSDQKLEETGRHFARFSPEQLSFVCNVNEPGDSPAHEVARQEAFLKIFGRYASASFNIYQLDFDPTFIFDYINRFGMSRSIRFGLAHPIPGEINQCIEPQNMRQMAQHFMEFAPLFSRFKVVPNFDCGLPLCVFTDEQLGQLFRFSRGGQKFNCGPAIDIGPDLSIWSCFPLHNIQKRSIFEFNSLQEIGNYYFDLLGKIRREELGGIFAQCNECIELENGVCAGGCVAHMLSTFRHEEPVRIPEVYA